MESFWLMTHFEEMGIATLKKRFNQFFFVIDFSNGCNGIVAKM